MTIDTRTGIFFTTIKDLKAALDKLPADWEIECHPTLKDMALLAQTADGSEWAVINMSSTSIDIHCKDGTYEYHESDDDYVHKSQRDNT